jgi:hypothetical protein
MFFSTVYRAHYLDYLKRIQARIEMKKLDLKSFYKKVMSEVKKNETGEIAGGKIVLDEDENPDWSLE